MHIWECVTCEYPRWWLASSVIRTSLRNSKFIPTNEKGHSKKCHSPLLLFHAGHYSDISRQFTRSLFVTTAAIIPDPNTPQDRRIWCLITSQNFVTLFANERSWTSPLTFAWCSNSWTWFLGGMYLQFPSSMPPISSNQPFSLFPKNFVVSPFTIITQQARKSLLLLLPE